MPCYTEETNYYNEYNNAVKKLEWMEAALCATLDAFSGVLSGYGVKSTAYEFLDYKEAGIKKKELVEWHKKHMEIDALRRLSEQSAKQQKAEESKKKRERKKLIESLTPEQRELLGV